MRFFKKFSSMQKIEKVVFSNSSIEVDFVFRFFFFLKLKHEIKLF